MFELFIVLGAGLFSVALRTFDRSWLRRAGGLGILGTSFLIGYFPTGHVLVGVLAVVSWFLLPWLEILTRIRQMRLPLDKKLRKRPPPSRDRFPGLNEVTDEIESAGFEYIEDAGWQWEEIDQFFRIFYHSESRTEVAVCLNEQGPIAFSYVAISSRTRDGKTWRTWNYPFSYTMKLAPHLRMNRSKSAETFGELIIQHRAFLEKNRIGAEEILPEDPREIPEQMQEEIRRQIDHNLDDGLIALSGNGTFRYSWRGLFFLWRQFVVDMVKFS